MIIWGFRLPPWGARLVLGVAIGLFATGMIAPQPSWLGIYSLAAGVIVGAIMCGEALQRNIRRTLRLGGEARRAQFDRAALHDGQALVRDFHPAELAGELRVERRIRYVIFSATVFSALVNVALGALVYEFNVIRVAAILILLALALILLPLQQVRINTFSSSLL